MRTTWMTSLALPAAVVVGGFLAPTLGQSPGRLQRVDPAEAVDAPRPDGEERADRWRARLLEPDLDRRQQHFERLLVVVRRQPAVRAALEEWAAGTDELAWTARLALREIERSTRTVWQFDPWGQGGFGSTGPDFEALREEMLRLLEQGRTAPMDPTPPGAAPEARSRVESFQLEMGEDGVRCEVTTEEDGNRVRNEYTADSIEDLLTAHPELEAHLGAGRRQRMGSIEDLLGESGLEAMLAPRGRGLQFHVRPFRGLSQREEPPTGIRTDVLGVRVQPLIEGEPEQYGLEPGVGLFVDRVEPRTIAESLGVLRGQIIVELNGRPIRSPEDISAVLATREPQAELRLVLIDRWGQRRERVWRPEPEVEGGARVETPDAPPRADPEDGR